MLPFIVLVTMAFKFNSCIVLAAFKPLYVYRILGCYTHVQIALKVLRNEILIFFKDRIIQILVRVP
jgi:hypothetical protein